MKRSDINQVIAEGHELISSLGYALPPFAGWSAEVFKERQPMGVIQEGLGWCVTDFGRGRFSEVGLLLFVARNARARIGRGNASLHYSEKVMVARKDQLTPMHHHAFRAKDVVNRGGGSLSIQLYTADRHGQVDTESSVSLFRDGELKQALAGGVITLDPGESITLLPRVWHAVWAERADVLIGEISSSADQEADWIFADSFTRPPAIDEDEAPTRYLVGDYKAALRKP